ncbi:MAG: histidine--tRNA ligase [Ruminococcaceae bacterium]|nr:histidine--tRNA ligase [Oscillospiraceae bacterium]
MGYIKTPVKGMNDFLPEDMRLREYVTGQIKQTYAKYGFSLIETPAVEHIENLTSKQGGDNEKLIFKIMKRGEKLSKEDITDSSALADSGLRYDLTVPLSRYYASNMEKLTAPFKAFQLGNVWRADRPQKGRFRQFTQCDIDILGDSSILAEIELVSATSAMLTKLGFEKFKVRINDRRILKAIAEKCGFPAEDYDKVFIILDKMDKIGAEGVEKELISCGYPEDVCKKYMSYYTASWDNCNEFCSSFTDDLSASTNIEMIISCVKQLNKGDFDIVFDPTLVRGMSYYTGTIFEIELEGYGFSIAGGGRYDDMIGKFAGIKVPACGFSIGFERIITILKDKGFKVPTEDEKIVFLAENGLSKEQLEEMFSEATSLRNEGKTVMVTPRNKNVKFQKDKLIAEGYTIFKDFFKNTK